MNKSEFIKTIKKEFEMCVKYPYYHSALYIRYTSTIDCALKLDWIEKVIYYLINEHYKGNIDVYYRKVPYRFNVYFNNESKFYVVADHESTRGLRNHHSLVDKEILKDSFSRIRHSTIGVESYNSAFGENHHILISKEDKNHFGKTEVVQINY